MRMHCIIILIVTLAFLSSLIVMSKLFCVVLKEQPEKIFIVFLNPENHKINWVEQCRVGKSHTRRDESKRYDGAIKEIPMHKE